MCGKILKGTIEFALTSNVKKMNEEEEYPMEMRIEYWTGWNYQPRAASLADALKQKYGAEVKTVDLIPSGGGAFEVSLNGTLLYSKLETGQFPTTEQITTAIAAV